MPHSRFSPHEPPEHGPFDREAAERRAPRVRVAARSRPPAENARLWAAAALTLLALLLYGAARAQPPAVDAAGVVALAAEGGPDEVQQRLEAALEANDFTVVAVIDHAANAAKAGLELPPTRLVIFGKPQVGTQLMQAQRSVALDLPQKMLIWQDAEGGTWVAYNDPAYLAERHGIEDRDDVLAAVAEALAMLAERAATP